MSPEFFRAVFLEATFQVVAPQVFKLGQIVDREMWPHWAAAPVFSVEAMGDLVAMGVRLGGLNAAMPGAPAPPRPGSRFANGGNFRR
jgi:hypothetical protein